MEREEGKKEFLRWCYDEWHFGILTPREQKILAAHYGFGEPEKTFREVATVFGVTAERIRQIEKRAILKLEKGAPKKPDDISK